MSSTTTSRASAWLACVAMAGFGCNAVVAPPAADDAAPAATADERELTLSGLEPIGVYETGVFNASAAEITAFDPDSARLFVTHGSEPSLTVLDLRDPTNPTYLDSLDLAAFGAAANSVATHAGLVAVAVEAVVPQDPGVVVLFSAATLDYLNHVEVGAMPDMLVFSPDGASVVVACEGEPDPSYFADPDGVIAIIDVRGDIAALTDVDVQFAGFEGFVPADLDPRVRISGPDASVAQDLEPEYVAISPDSRTAWVTLQENNALAIVDLASARVTQIVALGYKDHALPGNGLDPRTDQVIAIGNWPVSGMYMPDGIVHFSVAGRSYLLTANEGDVRQYAAFADESRVDNLVLDPLAFPHAAELQRADQLGGLIVSAVDGDLDSDGDFDRLHAFGARSIAMWSTAGALVWDSGDAIERATAAASPERFNASNDANDSFDARSDKRGPEPEGVAVAELWGKPYAFVGLERVGGVIVYDLSNPRAPSLVLYEDSTRNWLGVADQGTAGDLGPEGIEVVSAEHSPIGEPLLIVANEVSGTVRIYRILAE